MKLSIASALSARPRLLILDEATGGLDPVVRDEILDEFLAFIQEETHAILISSHITSDLEKVADYVTYLHKGKVAVQGAKDELLDTYGRLVCARSDLAAVDPALKKLLVLYFRIKNTGNTNAKVDLHKNKPDFYLRSEEKQVGLLQHTVANGELQYFQQKIKAGDNRQGVLVFEVDQEINLSDVSLVAVRDDKQAEIAIK